MVKIYPGGVTVLQVDAKINLDKLNRKRRVTTTESQLISRRKQDGRSTQYNINVIGCILRVCPQK